MTGALSVTTTHKLTALGVDGAAPTTRDLAITVMAADQVMVNTFTATPSTIDGRDTATLAWQTTRRPVDLCGDE